MGTILKVNVFRSCLASGSSEVRKSMIPFIIQEELDSPGCTLAEKKTIGFGSVSLWGEGSEIVML